VPDGLLLSQIVAFGRLLRRLGIDVTPDRIATLAAATPHLDLGRREDLRAAARTVLVGRREHRELFDRAFDLFWRAPDPLPVHRIDLGRQVRRSTGVEERLAALPADDPAAGSADDRAEPRIERRFTFSAREALRRKDFAALTPAEAREVRALIDRGVFDLERRRTRRQVAAKDGPRLDLRATLRRSLRYGGEAIRLARRRRKTKPRPLVALCDVSGSMEPYARILLRFLYALGAAPGGGVGGGAATGRLAGDRREAFVFGTRLTRITRQLRHRDPDHALAEAAAAVADWGGGTRIGEAIKRFNFDWGRRVLGQGAVVLVISDGWDRGDVDLLRREVGRLARSCDRLIWLNPLLGSPGYRPLTRGIRAVLPLVDDFLPVHNLESLDQLGRVLGSVSARGLYSRAAGKRGVRG
jgi:uncharacterized protein